MESLEEKFKEVIGSQTHVITLQNENLAVSGINKASEQCVEIAEKYAIEKQVEQLNNFAEYWDLKNGDWYKDAIKKFQTTP